LLCNGRNGLTPRYRPRFCHTTNVSNDIASIGRLLDAYIGRLAYFCDDCELTDGILEPLESRRDRSSDQFLVDLRELAGDNHADVANLGPKFAERSSDSMRRLKEDHDAAGSPQPVEPFQSV